MKRMSRRTRHPLWMAGAALVLGAALGGCTAYVKRGSTLYADGRYVEAAEVFEQTEYRLRESTPRQQAEYGLYRGLTLLALGDVDAAGRWLEYASATERSHPGALRGERRALLERGRVEQQERARTLHFGGPPPTALVASQPAPPSPPPAPAPGDGGPGAMRRGLR